MRQYGAYIFDLDGTLFRGNEPLPHAVDVVSELRERGALIRYLTNNSSQTRISYLEKLQRMGFTVEQYEVYSSAIATAAYCRDEGIERVFVVGEPGLTETLSQAGLEVVNDRSQAVVAGIHRSFTYDTVNSALQEILEGARFLATNTDATYPVEGGRLIPGAGAIVASIATCSGVQPLVIGKPNPYLIELVMRDAGIAAKDVLVVGDRYETDIESGRRAGCDTHLVLTGVMRVAPPGQSWSEDLRGLL